MIINFNNNFILYCAVPKTLKSLMILPKFSFYCTISEYKHNVKLVFDATVFCFEVIKKILLHSTFDLRDMTKRGGRHRTSFTPV